MTSVGLHRVAKGSFLGRDNIQIFSRSCQKMGIQANDCITPSMFDDNNRKGIVNGLLRFALRGSRFGLKPITFLQSDRMHECTPLHPLSL